MGRRQVTTAVTLLVLCLLLVAGLVWGIRTLFAPVPGSAPETAQPRPTCTTHTVDAGQRITASQVTVSVFNAGTRSGLADQTLSALTHRGFMAGEVGNAPSDVKVRTVQVWSTHRNDTEALLVAHQFGPKVRVRVTGTDLGPGVDVVVGNGFQKLAKAKRTIRTSQPQKFCVPVDDTNATG